MSQFDTDANADVNADADQNTDQDADTDADRDFKWTVKVETRVLNDWRIEQDITDCAGKRFISVVYDAQCEGLKKSLIALGWTPPPPKED